MVVTGILRIQLHFYKYEFLALRANTVEDYLLDYTAVGVLCGTTSGKAHCHRRVLLLSHGELLLLPSLKPCLARSHSPQEEGHRSK